MADEPFTLVPGQLTLEALRSILTHKKTCLLDKAASSLIQASSDRVRRIINEKKTVYGINTGFGSLARQTISAAKLRQLQRNLVLSHACGTGELLSEDLVSLILLLKINCLAQGYSGVRRELIDSLLRFFNRGIYPCVPAKGSVGASGDLSPLAHLALPLIGEGEVRYKGEILSSEEGLKRAGLKPLQLAPKEGLALVNGLQVSAALCIQAFFTAEILFEAAVLAGSYHSMRPAVVTLPLMIAFRGYEAIQHSGMLPPCTGNY